MMMKISHYGAQAQRSGVASLRDIKMGNKI